MHIRPSEKWSSDDSASTVSPTKNILLELQDLEFYSNETMAFTSIWSWIVPTTNIRSGLYMDQTTRWSTNMLSKIYEAYGLGSRAGTGSLKHGRGSEAILRVEQLLNWLSIKQINMMRRINRHQGIGCKSCSRSVWNYYMQLFTDPTRPSVPTNATFTIPF